ncbi:16S rRNA (cytidine1402-2'-O)-methyltransferase [Spiroplasma litorale]|uniref:16S rRNA (Cytidine1402-2'-O)-methyltransferase n=1 Tax=Spiroplasma litorale TaxID=216942 RepID=A0A0K1W318_9MOLU|nr:16S rRNA (cytidine(1402)-2'-O)-methyltransferase [Spiroplasma litorale]AKX34487.1 16S rRNA (cytidine1402-2'-O)-methyltransferase [Spiroplasma litorale]
MLRIQNTYKNDNKTLYLIGTPIGNLKDISFRVVKILKEVDLIYCEDKRVSIKLLNHLEIKKPLKAVHKFNEIESFESFQEDLRTNNKIALISDAGVPCICDPGMYLVNKIVENNINVNITPINAGPAYIHVLIVSGLIAYSNTFLGFLQNKTENSELINELKKSKGVVCFYESVHRVVERLNSLLLQIPESTKIIIGREISKINEQFVYGTLSEVCQFINSDEFVKKGEFCILIESISSNEEFSFNLNKLDSEIKAMKNNSISNKDIIKNLSKKYNINKNKLSEFIYKNK